MCKNNNESIVIVIIFILMLGKNNTSNIRLFDHTYNYKKCNHMINNRTLMIIFLWKKSKMPA